MASDLGQLSADLGLVRFWTWVLAYALAFALYATRRRAVRFGLSRVGVAIASVAFATA